MIYLDTSVALVHLLGESRVPPESLWGETLVSSRMLQYELWVRVHARGLDDSHGDAVRSLLATVDILELAPHVLTRALEPFPGPVRALDSLHLASLELLRGSGQQVELATYDVRLAEAARALGIPLTAI